MFTIEFSNQDKKFLKKADKLTINRILEKVKNLKENTVPRNAKFIDRHKGDKVFRVRIGNYRVLYKIKDKEKLILISRINKRSRIYDK